MHMQSFANGFIHGAQGGKSHVPSCSRGLRVEISLRRRSMFVQWLCRKKICRLKLEQQSTYKKNSSKGKKKTPKPKCHNFISFRHVLLFPMRTLVAFFLPNNGNSKVSLETNYTLLYMLQSYLSKMQPLTSLKCLLLEIQANAFLQQPTDKDNLCILQYRKSWRQCYFWLCTL